MSRADTLAISAECDTLGLWLRGLRVQSPSLTQDSGTKDNLGQFSPEKRASQAAIDLAAHSLKCERCRLVGLAGLSPVAMCGTGRGIVVADRRARARARRAS